MTKARATGALERTLAAMRGGAEVIAQATLAGGRWLGRADVLLNAWSARAASGGWSYEALDTKLARETQGGRDPPALPLLGVARGDAGRASRSRCTSCRGGPDFPLETYRVADYLAYYRLVRRKLEAAADASAEPARHPPIPSRCRTARSAAGGRAATGSAGTTIT